MGGGIIGVAAAAIVGALLAAFGVIGLVSSQSAAPATVDAPYITYDS